MANKLNLTWRDVLDGYAPNSTVRHIDDFLPLVKSVGYKYFSWNGRIYGLTSIPKALSYYETGLVVEDLT